jgi:hypothetical protein
MMMCSPKYFGWVAKIASQELGSLAAKQQEQKPKAPAAPLTYRKTPKNVLKQKVKKQMSAGGSGI